MITFKQFLEESKSAPLYHGTTVGRLHDIFDQDVLKSITRFSPLQHRSLIPTVYFSRVKKVSIRYMHHAHDNPKSHVLLQFDQRKITNNHKLEPVWNWRKGMDLMQSSPEPYNKHWVNRPVKPSLENDSGMYAYEAEEVLTGDLKHPFKYITKITVFGPSGPRTKLDKLLKQIEDKYPHITIERLG